MDVKQQYTKLLIDNLRPAGNVLQVGFALGDAAKAIQTYHPTSHLIIEPDEELATKAKTWADQHPNIKIINAPWQEMLPTLGSFDVIFFNNYPLNSILGKDAPQPPQHDPKVQEVIDSVEEQLVEKKCRFSEESFDAFCESFDYQLINELPQFLYTILQRGNISRAQYEKALKKFNIEEFDGAPALYIKNNNNFLKQCIKDHMNKEARLSSFLLSPTSKYEDPFFIEQILTSPNLDYSEEVVTIETPNHEPINVLVNSITKII